MVDIGLQVYRIDPFEFAFIVEYSSKMAKSFYWICKPAAAAIELWWKSNNNFFLVHLNFSSPPIYQRRGNILTLLWNFYHPLNLIVSTAQGPVLEVL